MRWYTYIQGKKQLYMSFDIQLTRTHFVKVVTVILDFHFPQSNSPENEKKQESIYNLSEKSKLRLDTYIH